MNVVFGCLNNNEDRYYKKCGLVNITLLKQKTITRLAQADTLSAHY